MLRRELLKCLAFIPVLNKICFGRDLQNIANECDNEIECQVFTQGVIKLVAEPDCNGGQFCYWNHAKRIATWRKEYEDNRNLLGVFLTSTDIHGYAEVIIYNHYA